MDNEPHLIFVLGMHRSGTSLLTEMLHRGGACVSSDLLQDIVAINARGFWEDRFVVEINDAILDILDSSWFDIRPLPSGWLELDALSALLAQAENYLEDQYGGKPLSVIKDPRLCRLLPFWRKAASKKWQISCLLNIRNPEAVAKSLASRNQFIHGYSELLWQRYTVEALQASEEHCPSLIVDYDQLLGDPERELGRLVQQLNIGSLFSIDHAMGAIDLSLRHHLPKITNDDSSIANKTYRLLNSGPTTVLSNIDELISGVAQEILYRQTESQLQCLAEQGKIGEQHAIALETLKQRDDHLKGLAEERNTLEKLLQYAESVVKERDEQLLLGNKELMESIQQLLHSKEQLVQSKELLVQSDEQLVQSKELLRQCNEQLDTLAKEHSELLAAHEKLYDELRATISGKIALHLLERKTRMFKTTQ